MRKSKRTIEDERRLLASLLGIPYTFRSRISMASANFIRTFRNNIDEVLSAWKLIQIEQLLTFTLGVFILLIGVVLAFWIYIPSQNIINTTENICYISMLDGNNERIFDENVEYTVSIVNTTELDTSDNPIFRDTDLFVLIKTNKRKSNNTIYEVEWPGKVRWYPPFYDLLEIDGEHEKEDGTTFRVVSEPGYGEDQFAFIWLNGKEKMGFSDRRIRLTVLTSAGKASLEVSVLSTSQVTQLSPSASNVEPDVRNGAITYSFAGENSVIFSYTEPNRQFTAQIILLIAGILIGIATNIITQNIIDSIKILFPKRK